MNQIKNFIELLQLIDDKIMLWIYFKKSRILLYFLESWFSNWTYIICKKSEKRFVAIQTPFLTNKTTYYISILDIGNIVNRDKSFVDVDILAFESLYQAKMFLNNQFKTYHITETNYLPKNALIKYCCSVTQEVVLKKDFSAHLYTRGFFLKKTPKTRVMIITNYTRIKIYFKDNKLFIESDYDIETSIKYDSYSREEYYIDNILQKVYLKNKLIYDNTTKESDSNNQDLYTSPTIPKLEINFD